MKRSSVITWEQIKVAAIVVVALVITALAMYRLGQSANLFTRRYELIAFLPEAHGVREGGSVLVAGQLVGTVRSIEFLPVDFDTTRNLRLVLGINERVREQIRADSRARIRTLGLLGDRVIDISPGTPRYAVLSPRDTIPVLHTLDYETALMRASEAIDDVVALAHDLRVITGRLVEGEGALGQMLTNRCTIVSWERWLRQTRS
jgi:phospholipid/cholesterol/gamma-HCH transport system substrate-binding protein